MSQMKQLNELITEMEGTVTYFQNLITEFKRMLSSESESQEVQSTPPKPTFTKEDVRKVLADKAASGYKDEVRALLKAYDATSLSTLDEKHYGAVIEEAGGIGHA